MSKPAAHSIVRLQFPVEGMTCAACSTRLERVLGKQPGVTSASVSLASNSASVEFESAAIDATGIAAAVAKAGFSVPVETHELDISGMTCAACSSRLEKVLSKVPG